MRLTTTLVLIALVLCSALNAAAQSNALDENLLADYAIALRTTMLKASLETYAEIIREVEPKEYFPILNLVEDKYGIVWALVDLGEDKSGYLTDIIHVRKTGKELGAFLEKVDLDKISSWDQEEVDLIQSKEIETGLSLTELMFAEGVPHEENKKGGYTELVYARKRFLVESGKVVAITRQTQLLNETNITMEVSTEDPEFKAADGEWGKVREEDKSFATDSSGKGVARYRISAQVDGEYKFFTSWIAAFGNSPKVKYCLYNKGKEIGSFYANHRLHKGKLVELGTLKLERGVPLVMEVTAEDGLPFSAGTLLVRYLNQ